jgi:putative SOS response-associated peptidase YedK
MGSKNRTAKRSSMCARFSLSEPGRVAERYPGFKSRASFPPRFNIAPTQDVLASRNDGNGDIVALRWGLIPSWAEDPSIGARLINARVETLAEKPAFRSAMESRRCVIFADGFFDWTGTKGKRQPYRFIVDGGAPFVFAGLYERWRRGDTTLRTCTIITCEPNELVARIHNRMPAILSDDAIETWLHGDVPDAVATIAPLDERRMDMYPVTPEMNHFAFEDPRAIRSLPPDTGPPSLFDTGVIPSRDR